MTRSRFWRRAMAGVRESLIKAPSHEPGVGLVLMGATIRKARADASGQKGRLKLTQSVAPGVA